MADLLYVLPVVAAAGEVDNSELVLNRLARVELCQLDECDAVGGVGSAGLDLVDQLQGVLCRTEVKCPVFRVKRSLLIPECNLRVRSILTLWIFDSRVVTIVLHSREYRVLPVLERQDGLRVLVEDKLGQQRLRRSSLDSVRGDILGLYL